VQIEFMSPRPGTSRSNFSWKKVGVLFGGVIYFIYFSTVNQLIYTIMNTICDFSVGFDREIEEVSMYGDNFTEEQMERFLNKIIEQKKIVIGERCEGNIYLSDDNGSIVVEYKYCLNVGEDWDSDEWIEDQELILSKVEYDL
jgi:hypothetical protein